MARHLTFLRDDADIVAAAQRLEKAAALFQELRDVLRLSSHPRNRLLRGHAPSEVAASRESAEQLQQHLTAWRDRLARRHQRERDEHKRADQATVLKYLEKYEHQLVGHVIEREGQEPFIVCRTNNPTEHRFQVTKRDIRRKVGSKKLTRQIQAMRAEALLVWNLTDQQYVQLVLDGNLANLPAASVRTGARLMVMASRTGGFFPVASVDFVMVGPLIALRQTPEFYRVPDVSDTIEHED